MAVTEQSIQRDIRNAELNAQKAQNEAIKAQFRRIAGRHRQRLEDFQRSQGQPSPVTTTGAIPTPIAKVVIPKPTPSPTPIVTRTAPAPTPPRPRVAPGRVPAKVALVKATPRVSFAEQDIKAASPVLFDILQQSKQSGDFTRFNAALDNFNKGVDANNKRVAKETQAFAATIRTKPKVLQDAFRIGGIGAYNAAVDSFNQFEETKADIASRAKTVDIPKREQVGLIKSIFRAVTPWNEEGGQTVIDFAKEVVSPKKESQASLKLEFDRFKAQATGNVFVQMWGAAGNPRSVVLDKKSGVYSRLKSGEAPMASSVSRAIQTVRVATVTAKSLGVSQKAFASILKARVAAALVKPKVKVDFSKIERAIKVGAIKEAELNRRIKIALQPRTRGITRPTIKGPGLAKTIPIKITKPMRRAIQAVEKRLGSKLSLSQEQAFIQSNFVPQAATQPIVIAPLLIPGLTAAQSRQTIAAAQEAAQIQRIPAPARTPAQRRKIATKRQALQQVQAAIKQQLLAETLASIAISNAVQQGTGTGRRTVIRRQLAPIQDKQIRQQTQTAVDALISSKPAIKAQQQIQLKTTPQQKIEIQPQIKTKALTKVTPTTKTAGITKAPPKITKAPTEKGRGRVVKIPTIRFPAGISESGKRETIKDSAGGFAWKQGELNKKPVFHTVIHPFRKQDKTVVLGSAPAGVKNVTGKGQAKRTIKLTKGATPPSGPRRFEGGAIDPIVRPTGTRRGVRIDFVVDRSAKLKSKKFGRMFKTKIGGRTVLSRRKLGNRRR